MIASESGVWTSLLGQTDLDLAQYIHPPDETFLCQDAVDDLIKFLGGDAPTTPPPSECDVLLPDTPTLSPASLIPTPALDPTPPASPQNEDDEGNKDNVPRHKRPAHKRAEVKRRGKIKTNLDDLRELLPPIHNQRKSESLILSKARDHTLKLKSDLSKQDEEKARLRAEIAELTTEIDSFQKDLPVMGLLKKDVATASKSTDAMYEEYVKDRTKKNWKFWIFSYMMRPLFETYTTGVSTSTVKEFTSSLRQWTEETLGLANLRSVITRGVLGISKETSILTDPDSLRQEAVNAICGKS